MIKIFKATYDDLSPYNMQHWAQESLLVLNNNLTMGMLCSRDYENIFQLPGDTINLRTPNSFTARNKAEDGSFTYDQATAAGQTLKLVHHIYSGFQLNERDMKRSFKDLVLEFLTPAVQSVAQRIDLIGMGCTYPFIANVAGKIGTDMAYNTLVDANTTLKNNKVTAMKSGVFSPAAMGALIKENKLTNAATSGDASGMVTGYVNRGPGMNLFESQNVGSYTNTDVTTGAVDNSGGYPAGTTTLTVKSLNAAIAAGTYVIIAGDNVPHRVTGSVGGSTPTQITLDTALKHAVVHEAVVTLIDPITVNHSAGYDPDYYGWIEVTAGTIKPKIGQGVRIGNEYYSVVDQHNSYGICLNRPLVSSLAHTDKIFLMPGGTYSPIFIPQAITIACRPLPIPAGLGNMEAGLAFANGYSVRLMKTFDRDYGIYKITVDTLIGAKCLNPNLGAIALS